MKKKWIAAVIVAAMLSMTGCSGQKPEEVISDLADKTGISQALEQVDVSGINQALENAGLPDLTEIGEGITGFANQIDPNQASGLLEHLTNGNLNLNDINLNGINLNGISVNGLGLNNLDLSGLGNGGNPIQALLDQLGVSNGDKKPTPAGSTTGKKDSDKPLEDMGMDDINMDNIDDINMDDMNNEGAEGGMDDMGMDGTEGGMDMVETEGSAIEQFVIENGETGAMESSDEMGEMAESEEAVSVDGVHTYQLFIEDVTWTQAQERCREMGGHLATLTTKEEWDAVMAQIDAESRKGYVFFVGAKNPRTEENSGYYWVEYTPDETLVEVADFDGMAVWMANEPSFTTPDGVEENAVLITIDATTGDYLLNDVPDDYLAAAPIFSGIVGFICEMD